MDTLQVTMTQDIDVEPEQMARLFWSMQSDEQVKFFNHLAVIAPRYDFEMQMQYVMRPGEFDASDRLTKESVRLLETIRDLVDNK